MTTTNKPAATITTSDLEKGIALLKSAATVASPMARADDLFAKAKAGTITADERDELQKSLADGGLAERATAPLRGSDAISKAVDVSTYLKESQDGIQQGLSVIADAVQKSNVTDHSFRVALATTIQGLGEVLKSQHAMMEQIGGMLEKSMGLPARGPRAQLPAAQTAQSRAQPINKSFANTPAAQGPQGDEQTQLSKGQILDGLDMMTYRGAQRVGGEDISRVVAKVDESGEISKAALADLNHFMKSASN